MAHHAQGGQKYTWHVIVWWTGFVVKKKPVLEDVIINNGFVDKPELLI